MYPVWEDYNVKESRLKIQLQSHILAVPSEKPAPNICSANWRGNTVLPTNHMKSVFRGWCHHQSQSLILSLQDDSVWFCSNKPQDCNLNTDILDTRWRQLGTLTWWWAVCLRGTRIGTRTRSPRWHWTWWQLSDRSPSLICPTRGCSSEPASTQVRGGHPKMQQVRRAPSAQGDHSCRAVLQYSDAVIAQSGAMLGGCQPMQCDYDEDLTFINLLNKYYIH